MRIAKGADHPSRLTYQCNDRGAAVLLAKLLSEKASQPATDSISHRKSGFFQGMQGTQLEVDHYCVEITLDSPQVDKVIITPIIDESPG
jgi:hypothetical protein